MTEQTEKLMKEVFKDGLNIYKALNYTKKKMKLREDFPEDVIRKVCECYIKKPPDKRPKSQFAWFNVAFKEASRDYFANHNQTEHDKYKKERASQSIKDIMRSV